MRKCRIYERSVKRNAKYETNRQTEGWAGRQTHNQIGSKQLAIQTVRHTDRQLGS